MKAALTLLAAACLFLPPLPGQLRSPLPVATANDNRVPAGRLEGGVLLLKLELRMARWYPDDDGGSSLSVPVFAEEGRAPQVPGPLLRVPAGTELRVTVANLLPMKATLYGLHGHPDKDSAGFDLAAGASRELRIQAGTPGTYHYYAIADPDVKRLEDRWYFDGALAGAFIVDRPGVAVADRVFVINLLDLKANPIMEEHGVLTFNGKAWPYSERLTLAEGEPLYWRVVNPTPSDHPLHLHGAYFTVLGTGNAKTYTEYAERDRRTVVTELMTPGGTFDLAWTPPAPGGWLFHCHFMAHMSPESALPRVLKASPSPHGSHEKTDVAHAPAKDPMEMGGLVLGITVTPRLGAAATGNTKVEPRRLELVVKRKPASDTGPSTISSTIREPATGREVTGAPGPPLVLQRGELVEIKVINQLSEPTSIHWHGIELESYSDGVPGVGTLSRQMTPPIPPGGSFVARMAPPRAGTFIYHTHWGHETQLSQGLYGALVVLEPGHNFDPDREKVLVITAGDTSFETTDVLLNGARQPAPLELQKGKTYRLRFINIAPNFNAKVALLAGDKLLEWRAVAKDGWELPGHQRVRRESREVISVGETYDFEFVAEDAGDYRLEVKNDFATDAGITAAVKAR